MRKANRLNELLAARKRAEEEKQWAWTDARGYLEERDLLMAALAKVYPSHLTRNTRNRKLVLCVHSPAGQLAWTIHSASQVLRDATAHLPITDSDWDGANTAARVDRLRQLAMGLTQDRRRAIADGYFAWLKNTMNI